MLKPLNPKRWNTYRTRCYTYDATDDPPSTGGVHQHQVQQTTTGGWRVRLCQSNGTHDSYTKPCGVTTEVGKLYFAAAERGDD